MDENIILMYTEFFQTSRDYLLHLQSITVLLLTACVYLYFKCTTNYVRWAISVAFVACTANLVIGLCAFSKLLSTILDLRSNPGSVDITQIGSYIWWQFFIGVVVLILILFSTVIGKYE